MNDAEKRQQTMSRIADTQTARIFLDRALTELAAALRELDYPTHEDNHDTYHRRATQDAGDTIKLLARWQEVY